MAPKLTIPDPNPLNPASLLHFAVRTAILMAGGTQHLVSMSATVRAQKLRYDSADPQPIARQVLVKVEHDLRAVVGDEGEPSTRLSDFANTYLPLDTDDLGLERIDGRFFEGLAIAGEARSRDEALLRLHSCRRWVQDHWGKVPKQYKRAVKHTIHDAFSLAELPAAGSHEATIALASMGEVALKEVRAFVGSDPLAFRLVRVATTALRWATKQPKASPFRTEKERLAVLAQCKLLLDELDDANVHVLYPARSLAAELASFADVTDAEWMDWLIPMLSRQVLDGLPRSKEDPAAGYEPLPTRTRAFLCWVIYSLVARSVGYEYGKDGPKPSQIEAFEPVRRLQKKLEEDQDPGIQYAAAYLKHVLSGGDRSFDRDNIKGFWAKQPAVAYALHQVHETVQGYAKKYAATDAKIRDGIEKLCAFALVSIHGSDRRRVLEALAASGVSDYAADVFARVALDLAANEALRHEYSWLLDHAVFALGYQRTPDHAMTLVKLASNKHLPADTRIACLLGAGDTAHDLHWRLGDHIPHVARELIKLVDKLETLGERRALVYALAGLRSDEVLDVLNLFRDGESIDGQDWVVCSLGDWGIERAENRSARDKNPAAGIRRIISPAASRNAAANMWTETPGWPPACTDIVNPGAAGALTAVAAPVTFEDDPDEDVEDEDAA